jgi:CRP-like cAMP-binding protein
MRPRSEPANEVLQFLCSTPLFSELSDPSIQLLASASRLRRVPKGEILFFDGDPGECAYVVRSGAISIVLNSPDGREMVVDEVHAGEMFGELELLTRKGYCAGARAHTNCELLVIPSETFLRVIDQEPRLARLVLDLTAQRLHKSIRQQMALAFMNAQARLARTLLALEEEQRDIGYVTVSQDELAASSGLIRQTVAKALGEWRRSGWLLTGRGRIVVLNRKALEKVEAGLLD